MQASNIPKEEIPKEQIAAIKAFLEKKFRLPIEINNGVLQIVFQFTSQRDKVLQQLSHFMRFAPAGGQTDSAFYNLVGLHPNVLSALEMGKPTLDELQVQTRNITREIERLDQLADIEQKKISSNDPTAKPQELPKLKAAKTELLIQLNQSQLDASPKLTEYVEHVRKANPLAMLDQKDPNATAQIGDKFRSPISMSTAGIPVKLPGGAAAEEPFDLIEVLQLPCDLRGKRIHPFNPAQHFYLKEVSPGSLRELRAEVSRVRQTKNLETTLLLAGQLESLQQLMKTPEYKDNVKYDRVHQILQDTPTSIFDIGILQSRLASISAELTKHDPTFTTIAEFIKAKSSSQAEATPSVARADAAASDHLHADQKDEVNAEANKARFKQCFLEFKDEHLQINPRVPTIQEHKGSAAIPSKHYRIRNYNQGIIDALNSVNVQTERGNKGNDKFIVIQESAIVALTAASLNRLLEKIKPSPTPQEPGGPTQGIHRH